MQTQPTELDLVVSKIRKLMALTTDRGATEHEASIAAEHVQRLMAEHNLSMATVEASGASAGKGAQRVKEGVERRQVYKWQRLLMSSIAELNMCKAFARFQDRGWSKAAVFDGYELIGREANVISTKLMFEYLLQTIERLAREDVGGDPTQFFTRYAHSFKEGCSDRLVERLQKRREEILREQEKKVKEEAARAKHPGAVHSNLPAIILRDVIQTEEDLNNDFQRGWEPGTTAKMRAENEAKEAARREKEASLIKAGYLPLVAYYMSVGYDEDRAYRLAGPTEEAKPEKEETEAQRRKRERREERQWERWHRQEQRERNRLDQGAYRKGHAAGSEVSLDQQVGRERQEKRDRLT